MHPTDKSVLNEYSESYGSMNDEVFRDEESSRSIMRNSEAQDVASMLLPLDVVQEDATENHQFRVRRDHLRKLLRKKKLMKYYLKKTLDEIHSFDSARDSGDVLMDPEHSSVISSEDFKRESVKAKIIMRQQEELSSIYEPESMEYPIEVRLKDLTYKVPINPLSTKIRTVYNSSNVYHVYKFFQRLYRGETKPKPIIKVVLDKINLVLKPGKMYLILGPPGSGKSSLLRAIAGRLSTSSGEKLTGTASYNGETLKSKSDFNIENAIAFIDQLDRHAPRLTVDETFEFAFQCKTGGKQHWIEKDEAKKHLRKEDAARFHVNLVLEALGLTEVKDTFVGNEAVRGVSGGQRRRVTVGEMLMDRTPILCGDEISTGLDAASTYEMIELLMHFGKIQKMSRVIALLQPSPETVSLFDEVIVIAEGKILFSGPIDDVEAYFADLGYKAPGHMDVADFLQMISTPEAANFFQPPDKVKSSRLEPYSVDELAKLYERSEFARQISAALDAPFEYVWKSEEGSMHGKVTSLSTWHAIQQKYANSTGRSTLLNLKRSLTIWWRDKRVLFANAVKNLIMGISVGGVFFQTDDVVSILGVLFQGMLFIMLGAMTVAPQLVDDRAIYRKHADANFFSAYPFVLGRTIAQLPQILMDVAVFGTVLYWMVGLAPTFEHFMVFLMILFSFSCVMAQILAAFASVVPTKADLQVMSACLLLFLILFGGFIVPPDVIPNYYTWLYWYNPFSWAYRALLVNEFQSQFYDDGDEILSSVGFVLSNGEAFGSLWVLYAFAYLVPTFFAFAFFTALGLAYANPSQGQSSTLKTALKNDGSKGDTDSSSSLQEPEVYIPFVPVDLTFENISYEVKASTGGERLSLLKDVSGILQAGRMCALMGSSGAGKTTLMDVIALRKNFGTIYGEVRLNGHLQEPISFRRSSGYVEQFDVQSPELTVRETVLFSARLRLDPDQVSLEQKIAFVEQVLKTLELHPLADCLVGSEEDGGLSFEQKKRVSIAVELAASPSIIFLDEPTSGLDARSALLVVKLLRRIADQGRTICATIHQPSSAVFEMFDDLLLLRRGGRVVFFGELGYDSQHLVRYFEARGAHTRDLGENPANWMLGCLDEAGVDLAEEYEKSVNFQDLKRDLGTRKDSPDLKKKLEYSTEFAASGKMRQDLVNRRLATIYWRSPAYNLSRMFVSLVIAFVLGSIFLQNRKPEVFTESQMRATLSVIFLSFIIVGILAIISVLPVMLKVRDMFYRHRASGMIDSTSLAWALGTAEKWFIVLSSFVFCAVFIMVSGLHVDLGESIAFWGFFTFNIAIYSYFGQAFVCFVKPMATAQILASVFIGLNNFFSGLIVRPQFLTGFFSLPYWITPGHYVYEGMIVSVFTADTRTVIAEPGTDFYIDLDCANYINGTQCTGTVSQYVYSFFGGRFKSDHLRQDALVLGFYLVLARLLTFLALKYINFSST